MNRRLCRRGRATGSMRPLLQQRERRSSPKGYAAFPSLYSLFANTRKGAKAGGHFRKWAWVFSTTREKGRNGEKPIGSSGFRAESALKQTGLPTNPSMDVLAFEPFSATPAEGAGRARRCFTRAQEHSGASRIAAVWMPEPMDQPQFANRLPGCIASRQPSVFGLPGVVILRHGRRALAHKKQNVGRDSSAWRRI